MNLIFILYSIFYYPIKNNNENKNKLKIWDLIKLKNFLHSKGSHK